MAPYYVFHSIEHLAVQRARVDNTDFLTKWIGVSAQYRKLGKPKVAMSTKIQLGAFLAALIQAFAEAEDRLSAIVGWPAYRP